MNNKRNYETPKIKISEFSVDDVICVTGPGPGPVCPTECLYDNSAGNSTLDEHILNGDIK